MDSATLVADTLAKERNVVELVWFQYGSKHNRYELQAAVALADYFGIPLQQVDLSNVGALFKSDLLQSGGAVPEGHYEEESMSRTVVPGRNMIFASILAGRAWTLEAQEIYLGIHAGDHAIYPDCRPAFAEAMREAIRYGTDERIRFVFPFINITKAQILTRGLELGVPYEKTRTCYKDQLIACGRCGACQERLEAFRFNGAVDPLAYDTRAALPKR